ncbi:hypothetical protein AXW37_06415 [Yersinia ruckeri]|uniref:hypothetical protein n=1 Tax=Yersinia ruckeri TaxID=29486 RepID=UPI0004E2EAFA|nr:hypothetical protein [Yersinia ruckeri]ARZ00536.1 hypothetical protein QMA0440_01192 [Yersinia ruckeri]EKN4689019.1 hypothetical protein [Yersinia ruckeri]KFE37493.1 hypothetical protein nADLYRO1b_3153 [Yersinia ruckeri]MCK8585260.1 hypothetical protein [Yersinia ruckeri]MCW6524290.1 hypothetical protein [Yersinia ruckeri]
MAALDAFLPLIRKQINGPLDIMMKQAVLAAAMTFCRESLFCRESVIFSNVQPNGRYVLSDSEQVKCVKRLQVLDISEQGTGGGSPLIAGLDFTVKSANQLAFQRTFTQVRVDFAVEPKRNVSEVPDVLADDYADVIANGALADLFLMPGKPWTDPQRSQYFGTRFVDGYRRAFREALDNSPITAFSNPTRKHEFY